MAEFAENAEEILVALARTAVAAELGREVPAAPVGIDWLESPGASFVTLTLDGHPRGEAGSLVATRSLLEDLQENAVSAAFRDNRFVPVAEEDFDKLSFGVSLVSDLTELIFVDEETALEQLTPGLGVVFAAGNESEHQAVFLPEMWVDLEHPYEFLCLLRRKAKVRFNYWGEDVRLWTFKTVFVGN
jgi:AmmeMemoRadiSam system protein A